MTPPDKELTDTDDLRSSLLSAVAEVEERTPGSTGGLGEVAKARSSAPLDKSGVEQEPKEAKTTPPKDATTGKFQPKDKPAEGAKPDATQQTKDSAKSAIPGAEGVKPDAAPATWKAEAKAEWDKLPPAVRQEIERREKDIARTVTEKATELNQVKSKFDEIEPYIGPRRAALVANYGSVGAAMKRLFDLSDYASTDPSGFIAWFSQQTGTDLQGLMQGQPAAPQVAPEVAKLHDTINGLSQRLQHFETNTQQAQARTAISELDALENETDQSGAPVRPFWADIRSANLFAPEIALVRQEHPDWSMTQAAKEAYDRVVWKHSDTRNQLLSQREQQAVAEQEAKARGSAAKNAQKSITGGPPGRHAPANGAPNDDLRAEISEAVYAQMGGGRRL